jgi:AcrR family transcriptional regulator
MEPAQAPRPRRKPLQDRSQGTVQALLEATARVLVTEGYDRTSTNRIARVAGVSVGSLYQYFPNKEALVAALVDVHVERMRATFTHLLEDLGRADVELAVRTMIRAIMEAHRVDPTLHRTVIEQLPQVGGREKVAEFQGFCQAVVETWLSMNARNVRPRNHRLAAFLLVHAVEAIVHEAVLAGASFLRSEDLELEVGELVLRYLRPDASPT